MLLRVMIPYYIVFLLFCCKLCYAQQPKLMLPIGHSWISNSAIHTHTNRIITAAWDGTAKIWESSSGKLIGTLNHGLWGVTSIALSPDEKIIITTGWDGSIKLWNAQTGLLKHALKGHNKAINEIKFSADGQFIITASNDSTSKIYNTATGELLLNLPDHNGEVWSVSVSPDDKKIATVCSDSKVRIWDTKSGKLLYSKIKNGYYSAAFSPDGNKIIVTSQFNAEICNIENGDLINTLAGHTSWVYKAQFSSSGKMVITISADSTAKLWDAEAGVLLYTLKGHKAKLNTLNFSADDRYVITGSSDKTIKAWDTQTGKLLADLESTHEVWNAVISPDSRKIVHPFGRFFKIYDLQSKKYILKLGGVTQFVPVVLFTPGGKELIMPSWDNTIKIWNLEKGSLSFVLRGHRSFIGNASLSNSGKLLATVSEDHTAKIWDIQSGSLLTDFIGHKQRVNTVMFSPDDKTILTSAEDGTARIWETHSGKMLFVFEHGADSIYRSTFSSDGKMVSTVGPGAAAKIWDAKTGKLITSLVSSSNEYIGYFADGDKKFITISDSIMKIWELPSAKLLMTKTDHGARIYDLTISPGGKKAATSSFDSTARIWNTETGKLVAILTGHESALRGIKFNQDGTKIITTSSDGAAKLWNVENGKELATMIGHDFDSNNPDFSKDGKLIATTSMDNTVKVWNNMGSLLYSFISVDTTGYLVVDASNRYDGNEAARKLLYFTCGTEVIDLDQVKDQLWVPNLAERIMKGETINAKTLDELNICGLTPEVEDATDKAGEYHFKIKPRRGGLGETVLLVNGIEARRYKTTDLKKNGDFFNLVINKSELKNIFIPGQENPVTVKAYTADNAISSRGLKVVEDKTKEPAALPNLYAVMVGVSDYKGTELDLKYAAKDAGDMSAAVEAAAKKLLDTDGKEHVFMYNLTTASERYQLPEKNSIKKLLEEIGKKATANDILMIFFAGHGVMAGEAEKKQFYFLTADASGFTTTGAIKDVGISTTELVEWMKPQNIKAQKRILIFDACNSGQAINDIAGKDLAVRNDDKAQQTKAIDKLNEKSGLFILSASASNQAAYEMGRYSQGLLTYSLLKAIKQQPDILEDGKYLDVSRWFNAGKETVTEISKENGARQEPQIVSNTNFNIGIVDNEVMAKIILPQEKPLFASSNFQNSDETADGDNLDLSKLINLQLNEIASRGTNSEIVYIMATNSPDALTLSGRYDVKENDVVIRVSIKKNNYTKYRFEEKGTKQNLKELVAVIVKRSSAWAAANK